MAQRVPDPYKALHLPHTATAAQIKRSYRELARTYHPDRCLQTRTSHVESAPHDGDGAGDAKVDEEERARQLDEATSQFAAIASAYAILSDPQRKAQYDHVYKYGGYDDDNDLDNNEGEAKCGDRNAATTARTAATPQTSGSVPANNTSTTRKRKSSTGIGYTCVDPLAFLWTHGRVQAKMAVAGIQIPSRLHPTGAGFGSGDGAGTSNNSNGFRFAFSSAHLASSPNGSTKVWQSKTTSYSQGQKFTRVETTTIYPDGRTETVVDHNPGEDRPKSFFGFGRDGTSADDNCNDPHSAAATTATSGPWYAHAWSGIKDKIMMCYSPCTVTAVQ